MRMHSSTVVLSEVASPHPRVEDTLNQEAVLVAFDFGVMPKTVPDSEMRPDTIGSDVHAKV